MIPNDSAWIRIWESYVRSIIGFGLGLRYEKGWCFGGFPLVEEVGGCSKWSRVLSKCSYNCLLDQLSDFKYAQTSYGLVAIFGVIGGGVRGVVD